MRELAPWLGTVLVILAVVDIYQTVLYPRGDRGLLSIPLSRGMWRAFRAIARLIPQYRDRILSHMGPMLLIATVTVWVILLILGFAFIYWPALGTGIQMSPEPTPTDFVTAFYFSGFSLSTLGTGDIYPKTGIYRLLMILQSVLGFSAFTVTLTYLASVYTQLIQRNVFAFTLHHRTARTADAAEMLARLGAGGSFSSSTRGDLTQMAQDLLNLLESQHSYQALGYFRWQEKYYALGRVIFVLMDTVTLIRSALDGNRYHPLVRSAAVKELEESGTELLLELSKVFLPPNYSKVKIDSCERVWRDRYYRAVAKLKLEQIETVSDLEAGADLYVSLRRQWQPQIVALVQYMGYKWGEIAPVDCSD